MSFIGNDFTTGSGRHVIKVLENGVVAQRTVVRF